MGERLERVLDAGFVAELDTIDIAELRRRRTQGTEVETALSYVRRLAQGRLDILVAELQRRAVGDSNHEIDELVQQLSAILTGDRPRSPGQGRFPSLMAPDSGDELGRELEEIFSDGTMGDLPQLSDDEAVALGERLRDFERRVSDQRRTVHERLALVERELVRRYKSGEASVDSILSQ